MLVRFLSTSPHLLDGVVCHSGSRWFLPDPPPASPPAPKHVHPLFPELQGIVTKTTGIAPALQAALNSVEGIELALIFGSTASGAARAGSDVDLLILGKAGLRKISPALRGVSQNLGREINPICFTPAEWGDRADRGDAFATRILAEPKLWLKGGPDALAAMGR